MKTLPNYHEVEKLLLDSKIFMEAAEAHGLLCGLLVCDPQTLAKEWISIVSGDSEHWPSIPKRAQKVLSTICTLTRSELRDPEYRFELLLPKEDHLAERAHSIGLWCKGFVEGVEGFGNYLGGILGRAQEDVEEALKDLQAISEVEHQVQEQEEQEKALTAIIEYVRIAVLLIQRELSESFSDKDKQGKIIH